MKKRLVSLMCVGIMACSLVAGCGKDSSNQNQTEAAQSEASDKELADNVAKLIDDIYVQERTDDTDKQ